MAEKLEETSLIKYMGKTAVVEKMSKSQNQRVALTVVVTRSLWKFAFGTSVVGRATSSTDD